MVIIEYFKDQYLTWRTGLNKQDRAWRKWQGENIFRRANTIENMFVNFEYILPVSTKIFDYSEPFSCVPCEDFRQYMYPRRDLDNCAVYHFARGYRSKWDGQFHLNDMWHENEQVFVATNNSKDAVMIALKYGS